MFGLIAAHLKSIGRDRLLPAGIVLTGGGAGLSTAVDAARLTLKLPSQVGVPLMMPRVSALDATWSVAFGLCRWGYAEDMLGNSHPIGDIVSRMLESVRQAFRSLLP